MAPIPVSLVAGSSPGFTQVSKPRISIVAPTLSGGGMTRVYLLGQVLKKLNYPVEIVGRLPEGTEIYPKPLEDLPITAVSGKFHKVFRPIFKELRGDIIYAVKPKLNSFGLAIIAKLASRRPLILDADDWELSYVRGRRNVFKHRLMERLIGYADVVTANNRFIQQRYGGTYLPSGKDTSLFDPEGYEPDVSRRRLGLADYRVLMFPGTPMEQTGLEDLLIAIERLNWPDLRLVLVGGRQCGTKYVAERLVKWSRWIIQLPEHPVDKLPAVISAAHIVVAPQRDSLSTRANFPMKLMDGMAMAKPILSTYVGDIPEILGDTAYLVEPSNPQQIAESIEHIFSHLDEADERGKKARQRCMERYSLDALGSILEGVISRLSYSRVAAQCAKG